ncbi:MAG: sulfatase [Planctomycetaceae bacterium]
MPRTLRSACSLTLLMTLLQTAAFAAESSRPNIIFFLSDDHRSDLLGCAGHPILKTPVIDDLARRGVRFQNAFVTTSICASSRATLFTGLWERSHKSTFGTPPLAKALVAASYPAALKASGYRTGFVGKFGVKVSRGATAQMFDVFAPLNRNPYFKKQPDGSRRHVTEIAGDRAIQFLQGCRSDQPFCLSVSFNAAHAEDGDKKDHFPWPAAENGLYAEDTIPPPLVATDFWKTLPKFLQTSMHRDRWFWRWDTPQKYQANVKAYYRMITGLDRVMGRVLDASRRLKLADNTVIIFCGDNGYYKGSRGFAGKWSHYEESLRVPLVICDPRVPQSQWGRVVDSIALNVDVPATITGLGLGRPPKSYQGRDLMPFVRGQNVSNWRTDFFCEHLFDNAKIPKWEGVRGQRYVYARYFENLPQGEFLHDLQTDPRQLKNLTTDPASTPILKLMRRRCDELRDQYGGAYTPDTFPTIRRQREKRQQPRPRTGTESR